VGNTLSLHRKIGLGVVLLSAFVLTACGGRDTSTVESSLNGQWELANATVNGQPIEEVIANFEEAFSSSSSNTSSESIVEDGNLDADVYFNDGELTVVGADDQQMNYTFEVTDTNEENNSIALEIPVNNEEAEFTLASSGTFTDEERETMNFTLAMSDITMTNSSGQQPSAGEQLGQEFAIQILENINVEMTLNYVGGATTPE